MRVKLSPATAGELPVANGRHLRAILGVLSGQPVRVGIANAEMVAQIRAMAPETEVFEIPDYDEEGNLMEGSPAAPSAVASDARPGPALAVPASALPPDQRDKTMIRLQIGVEDKPGGDRPVEVSLEGRPILIPRGRVVEVRWPYAHILKNAINHIYSESHVDVRTGALGGLEKPREALAYPVSFLDPV